MPESRLLKTGLSAASQGNSSSLPRFLRPGFLLGQIVAQGLGQLPHHSLKRSRIVQSLEEDQSILNRNDTIFSSFTGDRRIHSCFN
jgi:hypothetical protein